MSSSFLRSYSFLRSSSIFEVIFIFEVVFIFEIVLIYSMSKPNLLFTASISELKPLKWQFRVWHCSAKLKNLSVAWPSRALALLGSMSWISGMSEPLPETRALTNLRRKKLDTEKKKKNYSTCRSRAYHIIHKCWTNTFWNHVLFLLAN